MASKVDVFTKGYIDPQLKREELITRLKVRDPSTLMLVPRSNVCVYVCMCVISEENVCACFF